MLIAGVDEAGRGAVLGPLSIGVAVVEKGAEEQLVEIGVKDSKLLTVQQRLNALQLLPTYTKETNYTLIPSEELDLLMDRKSLNEIEAMRMGFLLNNLRFKPDVVYLDAPDPIAHNFTKRIKKYISFNPVIKSEHKADLNYPVVAAASIVAKVNRDRAIDELALEYGSLGSGYPHDERTIAFIKKYLKEHKKLPSFARRKWDTSRRLLNEEFQQKLF